MDKINWDAIAEKAASLTDSDFNKELASLTSLKVIEVDAFVKESKITNENALKTLKAITDATLSNNKKEALVSNIDKGVGFLIQIVSKLV